MHCISRFYILLCFLVLHLLFLKQFSICKPVLMYEVITINFHVIFLVMHVSFFLKGTFYLPSLISIFIRTQMKQDLEDLLLINLYCASIMKIYSFLTGCWLFFVCMSYLCKLKVFKRIMSLGATILTWKFCTAIILNWLYQNWN